MLWRPTNALVVIEATKEREREAKDISRGIIEIERERETDIYIYRAGKWQRREQMDRENTL